MLSEEEKKAIEILENLSEYGLCYNITEEHQEVMKSVLNLITKLQKEKEIHIKLEQQYKKEYLEAKEANRQLAIELEKKDKIINEIDKNIEGNIYLAESNYNIEELNDYARGIYDTYINMRKQYFTRESRQTVDKTVINSRERRCKR